MPGHRALSPVDVRGSATIQPLPFEGDDPALVRGILAGHPGAVATLYRRYAAHVRNILVRILGIDQELRDIQHDAFVRALQSIASLRDTGALKAWLTGVAVFTAKTWIQRRQRNRWLRFLPDEELPEREAPLVPGETREAVHATYRALAKLPADERVAFSLRFIDGMEIADLAAACDVSVSTIKRRLVKAERHFREAARKYPVLAEWLAGEAK